MWKLFLDDERYPLTLDWRIARNFDDAVWYITTFGLPDEMSLDHDLGSPQNRTGMDFVKWFCDWIIDNSIDVPETFAFHVHSQNPVGAVNMKGYLDQFFVVLNDRERF